MTRKLSSIVLVAIVGLLIPLTFSGCGGSGGNTTVPIDDSVDTAAAEASAAAEELPDSSQAAP